MDNSNPALVAFRDAKFKCWTQTTMSYPYCCVSFLEGDSEAHELSATTSMT